MNWEKYVQRFLFTKPVIIEDLPEGCGDEVIASDDKIIVRVDPSAEQHNMAEILSLAKLGEKDYLLSTFYFQPNLSKTERYYGHDFFHLCRPLQFAWAYKTMRAYLAEVYEYEFNRLVQMYEAVKENVACNRDIALGIYAVVSENPNSKINMEFHVPEDSRAEWELYFKLIEAFVQQEPSVDLYIKLAEELQAPYTVRVKVDKDGFRFFEVKFK